jgi:hypothetical protein
MNVNDKKEIDTANTLPKIITTVNSKWKEKYKDINIINEWISAQLESDRYIMLCGSLKNDSRQGVAVVIHTNRDGSKILDQKRFMSPEKHGALKVYEIGAKDFTMSLADEDGLEWYFNVFNGFDPSAPMSDTSTPQINSTKLQIPNKTFSAQDVLIRIGGSSQQVTVKPGDTVSYSRRSGEIPVFIEVKGLDLFQFHTPMNVTIQPSGWHFESKNWGNAYTYHFMIRLDDSAALDGEVTLSDICKVNGKALIKQPIKFKIRLVNNSNVYVNKEHNISLNYANKELKFENIKSARIELARFGGSPIKSYTFDFGNTDQMKTLKDVIDQLNSAKVQGYADEKVTRKGGSPTFLILELKDGSVIQIKSAVGGKVTKLSNGSTLISQFDIPNEITISMELNIKPFRVFSPEIRKLIDGGYKDIFT